MAPRIQAVLETTLYVADVARAVAFYRDIVGLRLMDEFSERGAGMQAGPSVVLLFRADLSLAMDDLPRHGTSGPGHVAFRVHPHEIPRWREHLRGRGVPILREKVFGDNPPSLYFRDPDGNVIEIAVASIWAMDPRWRAADPFGE